ncbi:F-box protein SKIP23-like [Vicia villosa]|uniref:F-box protein SKIP23-like n=1 Tax=Vicia villosa TaxID=3911 RepID=UPI00273BEECB|nr:F-box protein SKIP23-like [Vicia villosa]
MADWSQLPKELLQLISEKLNSEFYLTRFRSVCSTWRFSILKPYNHFPLNLPHFFDSNNSVIHKLCKHNIFLIKPPSTPNQQTPRPWLVRISPTSTGKFNLWHPLLFHHRIPFSLLDFNHLSVFDLGHIYVEGMFYPNSSTTVYQHYDRGVATFQGGQILDIVAHKYIGQLMMFRCGDDDWTKLPNVAHFNQDICIFKGRPCVTYRTGRTLMIGSDLSVHLVAKPMLRADGCGTVSIIVENESELLLVHKYKDHYDRDDYDDDDYDDDDDDDDDDVHNDDEIVRIDVFRLDQKEKKRLKLANLGDRVLFLGQGYSFIASALDLGFDNGNFVIYCNDNFDAASEMSIFHFDQQRNSLFSDYPHYFKLVWPPPEWITSRCL